MTADELRKKARLWADADPDESTSSAVNALIRQDDLSALSDLFDGELAFGTAGLRATVGPGPKQMNRAVVLRTTWGLVQHLRESQSEASSLIVVGFDARHSSEALARDVLAVFRAAGMTVRFFDETVPTPLVVFSAPHLSAALAVVITASHNPAEYNGYKVYGAGGAQIVPPVDRNIWDAAYRAGPARDVPAKYVHDGLGTAGSGTHGLGTEAERLSAEMENAFRAAIVAGLPAAVGDSEIHVAYTPLHGVGGDCMLRALSQCGYSRVDVVSEQMAPNGDFPTTPFPNPEEDGSLDLVVELAQRVNADLVLANDPDADRLAVAVRDGNALVTLNGNQLGVLLADSVLEQLNEEQRGRALVLSTVVSSPMLRVMADSYRVRYESTLTGFKWIFACGTALEREGKELVFAYEEAIGFCVGGAVRDKDGIGAGCAVVRMAAGLKAAGQTLNHRLRDLYQRYGLWVSCQRVVQLEPTVSLEQVERALDQLRDAAPTWDGIPQSVVIDYRDGAGERPAWLGRTSLVEFRYGESLRVLIRPSGTEPKLKVYVDLRAADSELPDAEDQVMALAENYAVGFAKALERAVSD